MGSVFMEECFRCSVTREETRLFDAIAEEGIVKACKDCIDREKLPIVKKPSLDQLKESEDRVSVRDKLSMMAGIESKTDSQGKREYVRTSSAKNKGEFDLNDVIERNLEKRKLSQKSMEKLPPEKELVENFHWKVMRGRRLKKISQEQLGAEIGESETAINMGESGELPEDFDRLIKKLEAYLRINLFKNPRSGRRDKKSEAEISFDPYSTKTTTVGDLKEKEKSQESEEEYPEQNKTRRSKLWNLFRRRARKVEEEESDEGERENEEEYNEESSSEQESYSENIDSDLSYDDLDDYAYQEYEKLGFNKNRKQESGKQSAQSYRSGQSRSSQKQKEEKQDSDDKKDKDELSRKDIDDLIFRKS